MLKVQMLWKGFSINVKDTDILMFVRLFHFKCNNIYFFFCLN